MGTRAEDVSHTPGLRDLYEEERAAISALVRDLEDPHSVELPACPGWSAHDLVSHLTGNCADVLDGNVEGVATRPWTDAQVKKRRDRSTPEVLEEWAEVAPSFAGILDDLPGRYGQMAVGDITAHEHDLRGALSLPGRRTSRQTSLATEFLMAAFVQPASRAFGLPPLEVRAGTQSWVVGSAGPARGDADDWMNGLGSTNVLEPDAAPVGSVEAEPFEWFRAISGRRSASQIRGFSWSVDPDPYLPIFGYGPFDVRDDDLHE